MDRAAKKANYGRLRPSFTQERIAMGKVFIWVFGILWCFAALITVLFYLGGA